MKQETDMRVYPRSIGVRIFSGLFAAMAMATVAAQAQESGPRFYNSPGVAAMKPPLSQSVRVGDILFMSGAIGVVPGTPDLAAGGIEGETKQAMDNIGAVLKANDLSFDNVVKCTVMLADMAKWGDFNKVYVTYFKPGRLPARSAFGASGLARNAQVEVECLAYAGK
jgi:2-iminobutanoate/2-iminopropanoate deaminase